MKESGSETRSSKKTISAERIFVYFQTSRESEWAIIDRFYMLRFGFDFFDLREELLDGALHPAVQGVGR